MESIAQPSNDVASNTRYIYPDTSLPIRWIKSYLSCCRDRRMIFTTLRRLMSFFPFPVFGCRLDTLKIPSLSWKRVVVLGSRKEELLNLGTEKQERKSNLAVGWLGRSKMGERGTGRERQKFHKEKEKRQNKRKPVERERQSRSNT